MKRRTNNRRGATAVEFALIAPLFFLIVFALFEFNRVNVLLHTADNAAYEGARRAIVPGATAADAIAEAERLLSIVGARGAVVTVDPPNLGIEAEQVTVTVDVPIDDNAFVISQFTNGLTMQSRSTLRTERTEL